MKAVPNPHILLGGHLHLHLLGLPPVEEGDHVDPKLLGDHRNARAVLSPFADYHQP